MPGSELTTGVMALGASVTSDLERAMDRGTLSVRGLHRVLRVAWTLADLSGLTVPTRAEVGLAVELRHQSRVAA